jgi:hypothetical protein
MVKVIPARLENGQVIPSEPLPEAGTVRNVSIVLEFAEPAGRPATGSTLPRLLGLLKPEEDLERSYLDYLEEKYR